MVQITEGKRADVMLLDDLAIETRVLSIMDRGYVDFARLHRFVDEAAGFLTNNS